MLPVAVAAGLQIRPPHQLWEVRLKMTNDHLGVSVRGVHVRYTQMCRKKTHLVPR